MNVDEKRVVDSCHELTDGLALQFAPLGLKSDYFLGVRGRGSVPVSRCLVQVSEELGDLLVLVLRFCAQAASTAVCRAVARADASAQQAPARRTARSSRTAGVAATCPCGLFFLGPFLLDFVASKGTMAAICPTKPPESSGSHSTRTRQCPQS